MDLFNFQEISDEQKVTRKELPSGIDLNFIGSRGVGKTSLISKLLGKPIESLPRV